MINSVTAAQALFLLGFCVPTTTAAPTPPGFLFSLVLNKLLIKRDLDLSHTRTPSLGFQFLTENAVVIDPVRVCESCSMESFVYRALVLFENIEGLQPRFFVIVL